MEDSYGGNSGESGQCNTTTREYGESCIHNNSHIRWPAFRPRRALRVGIMIIRSVRGASCHAGLSIHPRQELRIVSTISDSQPLSGDRAGVCLKSASSNNGYRASLCHVYEILVRQGTPEVKRLRRLGRFLRGVESRRGPRSAGVQAQASSGLYITRT
jgi:capsid protein